MPSLFTFTNFNWLVTAFEVESTLIKPIALAYHANQFEQQHPASCAAFLHSMEILRWKDTPVLLDIRANLLHYYTAALNGSILQYILKLQVILETRPIFFYKSLKFVDHKNNHYLKLFIEYHYNVLRRSVKFGRLYPRYVSANTIQYGSASRWTAYIVVHYNQVQYMLKPIPL